jgi:hypothetical protein
MDPMLAMDMSIWPHPGCAAAVYAGLALLSAAGTFLWFYLGFRQVQAVRVVLLMLAGLPFGMLMARYGWQQWENSGRRAV